MKIPLGSEVAVNVIEDGRARLSGFVGSTLSFVSLCRIFELVNDESRMAQVLELLGDKKVSLVKQVYFYLDDEFGCLELKDSHVKHYIKTSEMYHPLSNFLLADTDVDERIVIEFEVLG